jgi:hypothetical protein
MEQRKRAIVYIDGFNLYYGCLQGTAHRWLDVGALCARLLPRDDVVGIKYFTAKVGPRPWKPKPQPPASAHQEAYLRALRTVPNLSCHYGRFFVSAVPRRLVNVPKQGKKSRLVWNTEEKGSDVNLASHLLIDGFRARYDLAVVISNDSDLKEPVHFVRHDLKAPVGVLNPHPNRSWALSPPKLPLGSFYKPIRAGALAASQFPATLTDRTGHFHKPADW